MKDERWSHLIDLIQGDNIESMVEACEDLYKEAEISDISRLVELLAHKDFVVREAAAWPLASIAGPSVLPELFRAYRRGFDEGHDNDGFTTALIELVELHPVDAREKLLDLAKSTDPIFQEYSGWLLGFC